MNSPYPDFFEPATLERHIAHTMGFYHPRCIDPSGGFYHFFKDDGTVYDAATRHLVSSTRFVFTYAMAARHGHPDYIQHVRHGVDFLRNAHRNPDTGGYAWELKWQDGRGNVLDGENHCYGLAFVLLAYSHALMAGLGDARAYVDETFDLMEQRFWEPQHGLYADQASADWSKLDGYRGQNGNMHACEAMLAAYQATREVRFLQRAEELAWNITQRQAERANGMVWEHYRSDWSVDWEFNLHDKADLFRPWGYQPGHFTEWAKLLLQLEQAGRQGARLQRDSNWLLPAAERLFTLAVERAWDYDNGGIHYGFGPDGDICDPDKYFWVQAETLAAAALLAERTGDAQYSELYQELWRYCWTHFVDHKHGAWFRILSADNRKYSDEKSPAGKVDYHTMGACYDILRAWGEDAR